MRGSNKIGDDFHLLFYYYTSLKN